MSVQGEVTQMITDLSAVLKDAKKVDIGDRGAGAACVRVRKVLMTVGEKTKVLRKKVSALRPESGSRK